MNTPDTQPAAKPATDGTPAAPDAPKIKQVNMAQCVAETKIFLGGLVNNNLEMALAVTNLVLLDFQRMYNDQLRYAELKHMEAVQKAVMAANAAAAKAAPGDAPAANANGAGIEVVGAIAPVPQS